MPGGVRVVGDGHHRHDGVAVGHLHRDAGGDEFRFDEDAVGARARQYEDEFAGITPTGSEQLRIRDDQSWYLGQQPPAHAIDEVEQPAEQLRSPRLQQGPAGVDAGEYGSGRARGVTGFERRLQTLRVEQLRARQDQGALAVRG
jgi:hypothetical protein